MRSLQTTLMLWIGTTIAAILIVAGAVIYWAVYRALLDQFDGSLDRTGRTLAALIETDGEHLESEAGDHDLSQFSTNEYPEYYQIFGSNGVILESSTSLNGQTLPYEPNRSEKTRFEFALLKNGHNVRTATLNFVPRLEHAEDAHGAVGNDVSDRNQAALTLVVAHDTTELNGTLSRIAWLIVVVTATTILLGLVSAAWVAKRGLRPLRAAVDDIARIDGKHLDVRLDLNQAPSEVQPTIAALNQMLDRLKETFQREREFSANVAHELRTPLAGLKSTIEVAVSQERNTNEYMHSFNECLTICDETETIIANLFTLSRVDSGKCAVTNEHVVLPQLIRDTWSSFAQTADTRSISLHLEMDESLEFETDPEKMRLVLRNLFDNAISYSPNGTNIYTACNQQADLAVIQITNTASSKLNNADISHVFERFWRGDKSRSQTGQHSGLGLALCRSLIELLGGSIDVSVSSDNRFTASVNLPNKSSKS